MQCGRAPQHKERTHGCSQVDKVLNQDTLDREIRTTAEQLQASGEARQEAKNAARSRQRGEAPEEQGSGRRQGRNPRQPRR